MKLFSLSLIIQDFYLHNTILQTFLTKFETLSQQNHNFLSSFEYFHKLILIMKSSESSFPIRLKSLQSLIETSELRIRDKTEGFDQGSILKHYQQLRERQKQGLSKINMSKQRKEQLFNIPKNKSSNEKNCEKDFVILDHPLRGKTVMGRTKWENIMQTQQEQQEELINSIFQDLHPPQRMTVSDLHFTTPQVIDDGEIKQQEQQSQKESQNDRLNFKSMEQQHLSNQQKK